MTKEQDQIHEFKVMVEALSQEVKRQDELGLRFIDKLSMQFDDYLAHKSIYQHESENSSGITSLVAKFLVKLGLRDDISANTDPVIQNFINALSKSGVITSSQFELLSMHRMLRLDDHGSYLVMYPKKEDYKKAKLQALLLLFLTPLTLAFVWQISECLYLGLPISLVLGSAVGLLWKGTYNMAWGHEKLAKNLISKYPWFKNQRMVY